MSEIPATNGLTGKPDMPIKSIPLGNGPGDVGKGQKMNLQASNDNHPAPIAAPAIVQFSVGKTYTCRSICDWDCIFSFAIVRRSEKTVTIAYHGKEVRRTIRIADGAEQIDPHGRYSMSPVLTAKSN